MYPVEVVELLMLLDSVEDVGNKELFGTSDDVESSVDFPVVSVLESLSVFDTSVVSESVE